jgi:hypothetical protein
MMMEYSADDPTYPLLSDMQEPVLVSTKPNNEVQSATSTRYLSFLSFLTGSYMSVVHPILLSPILLTASMDTLDHRFLFALGWTVWTYFGMWVWLSMVQERFQEFSEANLFVTGSHYIAGSLLGTITCLIPQVTSLITTAPREPLIAALAVAGMLLWFLLTLCLIPNNKRTCRSDVGNNSKTRNKKDWIFSRKESRYLACILFGIQCGICLDWVYNEQGKAVTFQLLLLNLSISAGSVFVVKVCSSAEEEIPEERESLI